MVSAVTSGLTQKILQSTMELAIKEVGRMEEYIPSDIREKYHIAELNFAMKNIHFPENFASSIVDCKIFCVSPLVSG